MVSFVGGFGKLEARLRQCKKTYHGANIYGVMDTSPTSFLLE